MNHELWYTSAPRGLAPGSNGFCTVKQTNGIPLRLRELLESLSSYRAVYTPSDPRAAQNPVNCAHLSMNVGGERWHILSRIQDAGLDHTNRSNFFAHHVAFPAHGLPPAGPAWLLQQPGLLQSKWDAQAEEISCARSLPSGNEYPRVCSAWRNALGDAGWAGVVAENLDRGTNVYLIFNPSISMLPLVAEVLALLPAQSRWETTFSTYAASLPQGVRCRLQCVLSGSREETMARRSNAYVLDVTSPVTLAQESAWITAARTGQPLPGKQPVAAMSGRGFMDIGPPLELEQPLSSPGPASPPLANGGMRAAAPPASAPVSSLQPPPFALPEKSASAWAIGVPLGALAGAALAVAVILPFFLMPAKGTIQNQNDLIANLISEKEQLTQEYVSYKANKLEEVTGLQGEIEKQKQGLASAQGNIAKQVDGLEGKLATATTEKDLLQNQLSENATLLEGEKEKVSALQQEKERLAGQLQAKERLLEAEQKKNNELEKVGGDPPQGEAYVAGTLKEMLPERKVKMAGNSSEAVIATLNNNSRPFKIMHDNLPPALSFHAEKHPTEGEQRYVIKWQPKDKSPLSVARIDTAGRDIKFVWLGTLTGPLDDGFQTNMLKELLTVKLYILTNSNQYLPVPLQR